MRKITMVSISFFVFFVYIGISSAIEITTFGPKHYNRTRGKPNVYNDSFPSVVTVGEAKLLIKNGDNSGKHKVSSALIIINDERVLNSNDLNQKTDMIEFTLPSLTTENSISVKLRGKPGSFITVQIVERTLNPEQVLAELVYDLKIGDIQAALNKFNRSLKDEVLLNLDKASQIQLSNLIESAQLIESAENYKVYKMELIDEDGIHNPEFIMSPNHSGEWKIISW